MVAWGLWLSGNRLLVEQGGNIQRHGGLGGGGAQPSLQTIAIPWQSEGGPRGLGRGRWGGVGRALRIDLSCDTSQVKSYLRGTLFLAFAGS
jgi:hypothetical protein